MQFDSPPLSARKLGEDVAAPRMLYSVYFTAILTVTALGAWIVGNELAMVAAAVVASVIALYMLWDWLVREGPTRLSTLLAIALLLGYGLGAVNTWLTLPRGSLTLSEFIGADEGVLARGMAGVLLSAAPLCFLGELYERPLFGREYRIPLNQQTYSLIFLGTVAIIIGFFTHSLGFAGTANTYGQELGVAAALLSWFFPPFTALTVAVFLATQGRFAKVFTGICTLILCICLMAVGRRNMVYTAMTILFALRLTGYRLKGTFFKKVLLFGTLGLFLAVGVTVFMLLRLAGYQNPKNPPSLVQRIQIAFTWVSDGSALDRATQANQANVQRRTFVLGFFADVLEGSTTRTPALGQDVEGYISMAIPRVLNPNKDLTFGEESLADGLFGLSYVDAANSILTNGATDFGILGILLYPLILVFIMRAAIETFAVFLPSLPLSIVVLATVFTLLQTENATDGYLIALRNELIFAVILIVFSYLPQFRLRAT